MSILSGLGRLIFNPFVPGVLLFMACLQVVLGTPTWRTYASVIGYGIWLAYEISERRKRLALEAAQSVAASTANAVAGGPEHVEQLRAAIKMVREIQNRNAAPPPPTPTEREIRATRKPAIAVQRSPLPVPVTPPLRSYIGGLPQLPAQIEWPHKEAGERTALTFLAQIDLSEVPVVDRSPLPRSGVLFFFGDMNTECPEPSDCCVLYWPGQVANVAVRDLPATAQPYGYGGEPWPWLPEDSLWSRVGFRFPVEFVAFDSFRDFLIDEERQYPPTRNKAASEQLAAEELRKRFGHREAPSENPWKVIREDRDEWPFAWIAVEYGSRSLAHAIDKLLARSDLKDAASDYQRLKSVALKWVERAASESSCSPCEDGTRLEFLKDWREICAEVKAISKRLKCYSGDPARDLVNIVVASCYFCASNGAGGVIPEIYRSALVGLSDPARTFGAHQMLGHGNPVQSAPHDRHAQILLLQLQGDDGFGWHSHVGCVLQFWITPEALASRAFETVEVTLECD